MLQLKLKYLEDWFKLIVEGILVEIYYLKRFDCVVINLDNEYFVECQFQIMDCSRNLI